MSQILQAFALQGTQQESSGLSWARPRALVHHEVLRTTRPEAYFDPVLPVSRERSVDQTPAEDQQALILVMVLWEFIRTHILESASDAENKQLEGLFEMVASYMRGRARSGERMST